MQVDMELIEEEWRSRGFSCGLWVDPPAECWEGYVHEVDELMMIIEGELEIEMLGKRLHPVPGEEVLIPADVRHTVRNIGDNNCRWLYGYRQQHQQSNSYA